MSTRMFALLKIAAAAFFVACAVAPSLAQPSTAQYSVPVGRGAGQSGFRSVGPCLAGIPIVGAGVSSDPVCGSVPATSLTFTPSGSGAVTQTVATELQRIGVFANDYGAVCNSSTNDATAFQNAVNAAQSLGLPLRWVGTCKVNTALSVTASLEIGGFGTASTLLADPAISAILVVTGSGKNPVNFHDFTIEYTGNANASTCAISTNASPGNENEGSRFSNLYISYPNERAFNGICTERSAKWTITNSIIGFQGGYGITIANATTVDNGDSQIIGNWLFGQSGASGAVLQTSAGGTRFIGNKTNGGGLSNGYVVSLANTVQTGVLVIANNSFEGLASTAAAVSLAPQGASALFNNTIIAANEFFNVKYCVLSQAGSAGAWLTRVSVTDNICWMSTAASAIAYSIDAVNGLYLGGGVVTQASGSGQKVVLGSGVTNAFVDSIANIGSFAASSYGSSATNIVRDNFGLAFASLPATIGNGSQIFVTNADPATSPCTTGGASTGSLATRQNGAWKCF